MPSKQGPISWRAQLICPHCGVAGAFSCDEEQSGAGGILRIPRADDDEVLTSEIRVGSCPNPDCRRVTIDLVTLAPDTTGLGQAMQSWRRLHPETVPGPQYSALIPREFRELMEQAHRIRNHSPAAAAVLLRRCLEQILKNRSYGGDKKRATLADRIEAAAADEAVPGYLIVHFDLLREVGNWGAHADDVLHVEDGEIDQLFDSIEESFDAFFVKPHALRMARERTNEKLVAAGRNPLPSREDSE